MQGVTKPIMHALCALVFQASLIGCESPAGMPQPVDVPQPASVVNANPAEQGPKLKLHLYVTDFRVVYDDPDSFVLDVYFENVGEQTLVVLPSHIHRQYRPLDRTTATYVPYPSPRFSPLKGAFALMPRETRMVQLTGMRDGDGAWALDYGNSQLSLRYLVTEDFAANGDLAEQQVVSGDGQVWVGELQSQPVAVRYERKQQSD